MGEAYDAKFGKISIPILSYVSLSFFMRKLGSFFFCFLVPVFIFSKDALYNQRDIPMVMERLFNYHVENKELNEILVKRIFKLYIESFDFDRIYLLQDEALAFLSISEEKAQGILERIKHDDFSDFYALNEIISRSINRARNNRANFFQVIKDKLDDERAPQVIKTNFSKNENELKRRQIDHFLKFYNNQKKRSNLDLVERKVKVISLYNKKMSKFEEDFSLENPRVEHFFTIHYLKAFSKSLDAHTYFFSEEEAREMRVSLEKRFEGIGVVLVETIDGVMISDMINNSPAKESEKVQAGDLLVEINKQNVQNFTFEEVLKAMKQKEKGKIELGLQRNNSKEIIRVSLAVRPIDMEEERVSCTYEPYGDGFIGKLSLKSFYENQEGVSSEKDIKNAIVKLRKIGKLKGLILDLRENAGGFLSQAIKVAGLFMSNGVVAISKYSNEELKYLRTLEGSAFFNGPLVILTSKMSASASEIVAQALQDYGVAIIVGDETTFGKGSIQYQTVTNENADFYFKVTIGRYYTVSGRSTQIEGVKADIVVPSHYSPYEVGERYLEYSLPSDRIKNAYDDSLQDLAPKVKRLFQANYLPDLQKVVTFWTKMLPALRENSKFRLSHDPNFKVFLRKLEETKAKIGGIEIESKNLNYGLEDLQMQESINIVKDMIMMEMQIKRQNEAKLLELKN